MSEAKLLWNCVWLIICLSFLRIWDQIEFIHNSIPAGIHADVYCASVRVSESELYSTYQSIAFWSYFMCGNLRESTWEFWNMGFNESLIVKALEHNNHCLYFLTTSNSIVAITAPFICLKYPCSSWFEKILHMHKTDWCIWIQIQF